MKIKRLPLWATLAALGFLLSAASSNYVVEGFRADGRQLESLQDQKNPRPGATPQTSIPPVVKAASNLVVSPSFRISQASALSADRAARFAEVAYNPDDNEYLVVWQSDGLTEVRGVTDVYGQRINAATGQPTGISFRISNLSDSNRDLSANHPQVVYNKTAREYLVVWHGSGLVNSEDKFFEIYGQRLNRSGREIGGDFRISYLTDLGKVNTSFVRLTTQAQVAWNSTNNEYLVIWNGMGEPEDVVKKEIYGQRLKANGELLGKHFRVSHTTDQGSNFHASAPAIAYNNRGNQYLVVWSGGFKKETQTEVWGRVLSASGELSSANDFLISQVSTGRRYGSPHVDFNSDNNEFLVVFHANASPGGATANLNEIFAQRIDPTKPGETEPNNMRVSNTEGASNRASIPTVTYNGVNKEYLVIWRSVRANAPIEIWGQRLSSRGSEIDVDFQISNIAAAGKDRSVNNPSLTYNGTNGHYLIVWQGNPLSGATGAQINEIFGQQLLIARPQRQ
jgi:hypothetical protein